MSRIAVVLAGLTGRSLNAARAALLVRFPDNLVVRGTAVKKVMSRESDYDASAINVVLGDSADAIFGTTRRSNSFCRNAQRGCCLAAKGKSGCTKDNGQSCDLIAPDRFFVFYQAGRNSPALITAFRHAPRAIEIPGELYDRPADLAEYCVHEVVSSLNRLASINSKMLDRMSGILLPPSVFGHKNAVGDLITSLSVGGDIKKVVKTFRRHFFDRGTKSFRGSHSEKFTPAERTEFHGSASGVTGKRLALPRHYRLGCKYDDGFHWDVKPATGAHFPGTFSYTCVEFGKRTVRGTHLNVWPSDWIGQAE